MAFHLMARDIRSGTGGNIAYVQKQTGLNPLVCTPRQAREALETPDKFSSVPVSDTWRVPYLGKLLTQRGELHYECSDTTMISEQIALP